MIGRRGFLGSLLGSLAAAATVPALGLELDLDKLLWVPDEKTIFIPTMVVEPPFYPTIEWFTKETARLLYNKLEMARNIHRAYDDSVFVTNEPLEGSHLGDHVSIKGPFRPILMDHQCGFDFPVIDEEMSTKTADEISSQYLAPNVAEMAHRILAEGYDATVIGDLRLPNGQDSVYRAANEKVSVRGMQGYDVGRSQSLFRMDVLYGGVKLLK